MRSSHDLQIPTPKPLHLCQLWEPSQAADTALPLPPTAGGGDEVCTPAQPLGVITPRPSHSCHH